MKNVDKYIDIYITYNKLMIKQIIFSIPDKCTLKNEYKIFLYDFIRKNFQTFCKKYFLYQKSNLSFDFTKDELINLIKRSFDSNSFVIDKKWIQFSLENETYLNQNINLTNVIFETLIFYDSIDWLKNKNQENKEIRDIKAKATKLTNLAKTKINSLSSLNDPRIADKTFENEDLKAQVIELISSEIYFSVSANSMPPLKTLVFNEISSIFKEQNKFSKSLLDLIYKQINEILEIWLLHEYSLKNHVSSNLVKNKINLKWYVSLPDIISDEDEQINKSLFDIMPSIIERIIKLLGKTEIDQVKSIQIASIVSSELKNLFKIEIPSELICLFIMNNYKENDINWRDITKLVLKCFKAYRFKHNQALQSEKTKQFIFYWQTFNQSITEYINNSELSSIPFWLAFNLTLDQKAQKFAYSISEKICKTINNEFKLKEFKYFEFFDFFYRATTYLTFNKDSDKNGQVPLFKKYIENVSIELSLFLCIEFAF